MFTPTSLVEGKELENAKEDFRTAQRIEQYRISEAALYIPEGLRWKYIPFSAVSTAEESFRVVSGGHCVPIREKRPEMDLATEAGTIHLQLEKPESMQMIQEILQKQR